MSGISQASGILTARANLLAAARVALTAETDIDFYSGWQWPVTQPNWVALTDTSVDLDPRDIGPRRQQDETITFGMSLGAWVGGHTQAQIDAAFTRAFEILDTIQTHIRTQDITLGDSVLWCLPGSIDSDGSVDEDGSGYLVEIAATFVCMHRVRGN